jgi:hypothetical protein
MRKISFFCLAIAVSTPAWSQVQPSASGGGYDLDSEHMMTPPPVSRQGYPATAGSEQRTNFIAGGLVFTAAATDNLMLLGNEEKTPDQTYSFLPTVEIDRKTPKDEELLNYNTGFTLYHTYSQLNGITQDATATFKYHFTPYAVVIFRDRFYQNYNSYNQGNPFTGGGVSGSPGSGAPGSSDTSLIEPYANQLSNASTGAIEYQYAKNSMVGLSGVYSFLQFSGNSYIPELSDQNTTSGNAFYSRRFGRSYAGVTYQFSKFVTHPYGSYTLTNTVFGFYTHYFTRTISISLLGGPEHYTSWTQEDPTKASAWSPAVQASVGWQVAHANLAANYAHVVSGAGGLIGTFHSDTGTVSCQYLFTRLWSASAHVDFSNFENINSAPSQFAYYSGGNSISGGIDVQRRILESVSMEAGYQHLYQSYPGVTTSSALENSNRGYISVLYHFNRPLGR